MATYDPTLIQTEVKSGYPVNAVDAQATTRVEALLTPKLLVDRFLKGIPLISASKNPITGKPDRFDNPDDLKDQIVRAVGMFEQATNIPVMPIQFIENHPFDRNLLDSFMYFKTERKPILSVDQIAIQPGVGLPVYVLPPQWISTAQFPNGQINLVPLVSGYSQTFLQAATGGGAVFLQIVSGSSYIPAFWNITYTVGFKDGQIPVIVNELIGCYAAIELLDQIQTTNRSNSSSMGMDGASQSVSTQGPTVYSKRIESLTTKAKELKSKLKAMYGHKWVMGEI